MKKTLILASLIAFAATTQCFAADTITPSETPKKEVAVEAKAPAQMQVPPKQMDCKRNKKAEFEKRLKLTDEQKAKAKALREKGHEEMKPIMEQIKLKHQEIKKIKESRIIEAEQNVQIERVRGELKELKKKAHDIRIKNMKEFEALLTKKQLKELKKMKKEGRKKFEKQFKKRHGCGLKPPFPPEFGRKQPTTPDFGSQQPLTPPVLETPPAPPAPVTK